MKKKFIPAEIREWGKRWMIVFHQVNPADDKLQRFARSFNINRIKSVTTRRKRAREIVRELNEEWLPNGYPFAETIEYNNLDNTNIVDAIKFAVACKSISESTGKSYSYVSNKFMQYLKARRLEKIRIADFNPKMALGFLDYLTVEQKLANLTRNNIASKIKTVFSVLESREYIHKGMNPFEGYTILRVEEKERRPLETDEKEVLAKYIKEKDPYLYLAVNIMYYCFVRKAEMRRLKFRYFDLERSIIRIPGKNSKNKRSQIVTIPKPLIKLLKEFKFDEYPGNWIPFGKHFKPHDSIPCGINTPTARHRKLVDELGAKGKLRDVKGIHFYSWKDTGVLNMIERGINIRQIQNQLRHSSLEETQKYLKQIHNMIPEIRGIESDI